MTKPSRKQPPLTYISLFSGAGVGCHGFQSEGFECIAANELIERRLNIQKYNGKCRYESAYVHGDITSEEVKNQIRRELAFWREVHGVERLDALIATPPCQGMSVANHKKGNELARNSLVAESIRLVKEFGPRFFLFENVRTFLNSICTDLDGKDKKIREAIEINLGGEYNIHCRLINFKDYGVPSSRTRTLILGVRKSQAEVTPLDFMPTLQKETTVRQAIGHFRPLRKMGEIDKDDVYHNFRPYPERMLPWIEKIKEGESAFDNTDPKRLPHRVVGGETVLNVRKNGDKYARCFWDKPGACVHTRNDIMSSQSTLHPQDNRVFSIRELMRLMSIPDSFKWSAVPEQTLNALPREQKRKFLKKEEMNIRQSIGEAVPTAVFQQVAAKMKEARLQEPLDDKEAQKIIARHGLAAAENLKAFLKSNLKNHSFPALSRITELANAKRLMHAAYYTRQDICFTVVKDLPDASRFQAIKILEPSVGAGNFLPLLIEKYKTVPSVEIDVMDIDENAIDVLKLLVRKLAPPRNVEINFLVGDFLLHGRGGLFGSGEKRYDIIVGNPPFGKLAGAAALLAEYRKGKANARTGNLFSFFLEEALQRADTVALITPKSLLSAPEFNDTRALAARFAIEKITDYGEKAFKGVRIETISLILNTKKQGAGNRVLVESYVKDEMGYKPQDYVCSKKFPCWLLYRDRFFDGVAAKLLLGIFTAYRDRQITKKITKPQGKFRVLKSRNIGDNAVIDIPEYDAYVDKCENLSIAKYVNHDEAVLVPNLTYNPRACFLPPETITDGSVAVLVPKAGAAPLTERDLGYYSSHEFVKFYRVARNHGTRSLNIDANSVFFFGRSECP